MTAPERPPPPPPREEDDEGPQLGDDSTDPAPAAPARPALPTTTDAPRASLDRRRVLPWPERPRHDAERPSIIDDEVDG